MIGDYKSIYQAQSCNEDFTLRGGGGIVTSLLLYLLRENKIDDILLVTSSDSDPWAKADIVNTEKGIKKASGSKYTFVDYQNKLDKMTDNSAIVGLPCQLKIKKSFKIKIGLFCGLNISPDGYNYLFKKLGIKREDIMKLEYRAPDKHYMHIHLKNGEKITFPRYSWLAFLFPYKKCIYCQDFTSRSSDISVGDFKNSWSSVITRTKLGKDTLIGAEECGYIKTKSLELDEFINRKARPIYHKEINKGYRNLNYIWKSKRIIDLLPLWAAKKLASIYNMISTNKARGYFDKKENNK